MFGVRACPPLDGAERLVFKNCAGGDFGEGRPFFGSRAMTSKDAPPFYHGAKADLRIGDLIAVGYASN